MKTRPPADPSRISFDERCFRIVGKKRYWKVINPSGWGYPVRFENQAEAEAYARKRRWRISEGSELISKRIAWTLEELEELED